MTLTEAKEKTCTHCGLSKPLGEYDTNGKLASGIARLHSWCKACLRANNRDWQSQNEQYFKDWAAAHPEKIRAAQLKYRTEHPDMYKAKRQRYNESHREKICEYRRRYRTEHTDQIQEYMQGYLPEYYLEHKDELIEYQRLWRATPTGRAIQRVTRLKRRAAKMGSQIGDDVGALIKQIKLSPFVTCHLCGATLPGWQCHIDHITPLSKGGAHTRENIAPACPTCNIKKGAKLLFDVPNTIRSTQRVAF